MSGATAAVGMNDATLAVVRPSGAAPVRPGGRSP